MVVMHPSYLTAIHQRVLYCDISDITNHRTDKWISVLGQLVDTTAEKNQRNRLLVPKEALIGEHNLKPLLTVHKESIDW